jgi:diguanylate cyclase (GGDEF)-like protein/PAS domain S-box-containing protein
MDWSSFRQLTAAQIDRYAGELEEAIENHLRWAARVNRTLLAGEAAQPHDVAEEPHLLCSFGRWYHGEDKAPLAVFPEFVAIGPVHARIHALARDLLLHHRRGEPVDLARYDTWVETGDELRRLLTHLQQSLHRDLGLSSRLMAQVFEHAAEGVVITAPDGTILTVNRAFTEVTGYQAEEVLGKTPQVLRSGRQDRRFYEHMWGKLMTDGEWQGEIWNRRKNGEVYLEWLVISAVRDEREQITNYVAVFSDITAEKQNEERLYHLAHYDPLTELPNRVLFQDRFTLALARARRGGRKIAVMFLDLDGFKEVNDKYGHTAGDTLLAQVAARLSTQLRKSDTVARLGGDEFAIILPDLFETVGLDGVAQKIIESIAKPFTLGGTQRTHITTSVGISLYPADGGTSDDLLRRADVAMYEAKRRGKNQLCFYTPEME